MQAVVIVQMAQDRDPLATPLSARTMAETAGLTWVSFALYLEAAASESASGSVEVPWSAAGAMAWLHPVHLAALVEEES